MSKSCSHHHLTRACHLRQLCFNPSLCVLDGEQGQLARKRDYEQLRSVSGRRKAFRKGKGVAALYGSRRLSAICSLSKSLGHGEHLDSATYLSVNSRVLPAVLIAG